MENLGLLGFVSVLLVLSTYYLMHLLSTSSKFRWIPEASLLILCGLCAALILQTFIEGYDWQFNSNLFYYLLLPPIIFNSGLDIDFECFQQNFVTIMVYANIGTIVNAIVVCVILYLLGQSHQLSTPINIAEGVTFGALISATDPCTTLVVFDRLHVEQNLFGIVVGVSVLDDAVAVIIFNLFNHLISNEKLSIVECFVLFLEFLAKFCGSMFVGSLVGIFYAKLLNCHRQLTLKIPQLIGMTVAFIFLVYYFGDGFWLSGIITTLFAAMYFRRYYEKANPISYEKLKIAVGGFSYLLESLVFVQIGLSLLSHPMQSIGDWKFFAWSIFACLIGRAAQIYPLAAILNCYNRLDVNNIPDQNRELEDVPKNEASFLSTICSWSSWKLKRGIRLPLGYQHMIFLAGLRGPIAYATAQLFDDARHHQDLVAATTSLTVIITTTVFGILTWPALKWFQIPHKTESGINTVIAPSSDSGLNTLICAPTFDCLRRYLHFSPHRAVIDEEDGISLHNSQNVVTSQKKWELLKSSDEHEEDIPLEIQFQKIVSVLHHSHSQPL